MTVQRYSVDTNDPWGDIMYPDDTGSWVRWEDIRPLLDELKNLRGLANSIDEALNTGDGVYRP